ncbi:HD domain-containing phosphohydrolase [Sulfurimonas sp.]|uniref:HD domain-containing phosphohydrolase n=1 Tax=Sulfurimonas sp. TaxID=2022749 RepID=UPI002AB053BA|nr:HD domain-containing phosphohydrolase [Sulfurimonas sp.]
MKKNQVEYNILIVDDVSENIKVAINILQQDEYNFSFALNGEQALEVLKTKKFDLILLDIMMPGIDGFEVCEIVKKTTSLKDIPIIFVTAKVDIESIEKGFTLGAVDYVTKPFHAIELKSRVKNHLELYRAKQQLKANNITLFNKMQDNKEKHFTDLELAQKEIIYILSDIMETGSSETASHVKRVAHIAKRLAQLEGTLNKDEIKIIFLATPLHDIGKILIDGKILHKPGKLDDDEFKIMKEHSAHAYKILAKSNTKLIKAGSIIAYQHHENYDGSGYPNGLFGDDIHIYGRIVAIADVLDALTHKRAYKEAWSFEKAANHIIELSGTKFDPKLIVCFRDNLKDFRKIIEHFKED